MAGYQDYLSANIPGMVPSPGLGAGGMVERTGGSPQMRPGSPNRMMAGGGGPAPSPGLGSGIPNTNIYEDNSIGFSGVTSPSSLGPGGGDPLLMLIQKLLNQRFPNGM